MCFEVNVTLMILLISKHCVVNTMNTNICTFLKIFFIAIFCQLVVRGTDVVNTFPDVD